MNDWKLLITFTYPHEAHVVLGYLESEGLTVVIKDELMAQINNFYSNAIGGVKILIPEDEYEQGIEALKKGGFLRSGDPAEKKKIEIVKIDGVADKDHCPFCTSDNVAKNHEPNLATIIIYFLFGAFFPVMRDSYKCFDCGKEWKYSR